MNHPKIDVNRVYIPRNKGRRGMIQLKLSYKTSTIGQHKYLKTKEAWILPLVLEYDKTRKDHSIVNTVRNLNKN